jgi:hypothetical protein
MLFEYPYGKEERISNVLLPGDFDESYSLLIYLVKSLEGDF